MAFFPRFMATEMAPVFRLLDEYASHAATVSRSNSINGFGAARSSFRTFQPRFDVKETQEGYVLQGEMPGVEQKDLDIQFTDSNTLSIRGRTEQVREEGHRSSAQAATVEAQPEPNKITEGSEGESTAGYHKATVEDEAAAGSSATSEAVETPAATPSSSTETAQVPTEQAKAEDEPRYWLHERSVGEFSRSFKFGSRVDQDSVKASLKNGILSILIPKAAAPVSRRINVE